ncbi:restriction endonuclease [Streptomyces brevispora]|uniref:restriction endonuclease n=1 Tax=Streptomyces brevispora TaxID=887462 RepID=UPI003711DCC6
MSTPWDWVNDRSYVEHLSELIGIKLGLAATNDQIKQATKNNFPLVEEYMGTNAEYKAVHSTLSAAVLENFGFYGALRAIDQPIVVGINDRLSNFELSVRAAEFVIGRMYYAAGEARPVNLGPSAQTAFIILIDVTPERTRELIQEAKELAGRELADAVEVALDEVAFRFSRGIIRIGAPEVAWRDSLALAELFDSESTTATYGKFFDQRFIDYLAANFDQIGEINWRKFEALTAEYFDRQGYEVELGAGRNDNGVDLRIWESGARGDDSAPTIIVQCKREKQKIQKVVVKALAADVKWEGAEQGLLVATADWLPGAREVVKTRSYPVSEVNRTALKEWLIGMRTSGSGLWLP